jgi:hypothetical protein
MRAVVVYESIFGNTERVARAIAEGLRTRGDVEVLGVDQAPERLDGVDLLVVGGPTHAWGMSRPQTRADARQKHARAAGDAPAGGRGLREWLAGLETRDGAAAAFDTAVHTSWFPTGSAARAAVRPLEERGWGLVAPPEQFRVLDTEGPLLEGEVERARAWGVSLAEAHARGVRLPAVSGRQPEEEIPPAAARYVADIVATVIGLVVMHAHDVWRPLLGGIVTAEWADVLWVVNLTSAVRIAGNAALVATRPLWLRRLVEVVNTATGVIGLAVFVRVFPFDFGALAPGADGMLRATLAIALFGVIVATLVQLVRFVAMAPFGETRR